MKAAISPAVKYTAVVGMKELGSFNSFKGAARAFFREIKLLYALRRLNPQLIETTCWLVESSNGRNHPSFFHQVKVYCIDQGWVENKTGRWIGG